MEADSGLALTRQQAIVKNNDGPDLRSIYMPHWGLLMLNKKAENSQTTFLNIFCWFFTSTNDDQLTDSYMFYGPEYVIVKQLVILCDDFKIIVFTIRYL